MTPAALKALLNGDTANFLVASTPGGIEAQEAREQQRVTALQQLPKRGTTDTAETRSQWESLGFKFGSDADDLFVNVTFPEGWKMVPTNHSMWSDLLDDKGRKRAAMFYKGAFYDRSAHIQFVARFSYGARYDDSGKRGPVAVYDQGQPIHVLGDTRIINYKQDELTVRVDEAFNDILHQHAKAWLMEHYPDWKNPLAYWSD